MGNVVALGGGFDNKSAHRWKLAKYLNSLTNKKIDLSQDAEALSNL